MKKSLPKIKKGNTSRSHNSLSDANSVISHESIQEQSSESQQKYPQAKDQTEIKASVLVEYYWRSAKEHWSKRDFKGALQATDKIQEMMHNANDMKGLESTFSFKGDIFLDNNNVKEALICYQQQKNLAEQNKDYKDKMLAYKQLGHCYKLLKEYRLALINFKKLLQLAWSQNSIKWELLAYDYIGMQYYYLGDLDRAKYYHDRMWKGILEDKTSPVRELSMKALEAKQQRKNNVDERREKGPAKSLFFGPRDHNSYYLNGSDDDESELPSPRTSSGNGDVRLLPHFKIRREEEKKRHSKTAFIKHGSRGNEFKNSTSHKRIGERVKPFILLSHLSPIESLKNFYYVEQMHSLRYRDSHKNINNVGN